jgi:hypothetical protein
MSWRFLGVASDVRSIQNFGRDASRCRVRARRRARNLQRFLLQWANSRAAGGTARIEGAARFLESACAAHCSGAAAQLRRAPGVLPEGKQCVFPNGKNDTPE